jgi:hypothetical protein
MVQVSRTVGFYDGRRRMLRRKKPAKKFARRHLMRFIARALMILPAVLLVTFILPSTAETQRMGRNERELKERLWGKERVYRKVNPNYRQHMGRNERELRRQLWGEDNVIRELERRSRDRKYDSRED